MMVEGDTHLPETMGLGCVASSALTVPSIGHSGTLVKVHVVGVQLYEVLSKVVGQSTKQEYSIAALDVHAVRQDRAGHCDNELRAMMLLSRMADMLVTVASLSGATPGLPPAVDGVTGILGAKQTDTNENI